MNNYNLDEQRANALVVDKREPLPYPRKETWEEIWDAFDENQRPR